MREIAKIPCALCSRGIFFFAIMINIQLQDLLELKKKHPCGCNTFVVLRLGSDIKLKCSLCAREITLPRIKLERMIRKISNAGKT